MKIFTHAGPQVETGQRQTAMDEQLREELASIRNMLNEVLVNQDILAKRINADTAIKAVQTERAVELARLRRTADKAMKVSA